MENYILTDKEQKTYDFILKYSAKYGRYPLLIEIAQGIGIKSKGVAHRYVKALEKANKLKKGYRTERAKFIYCYNKKYISMSKFYLSDVEGGSTF